MRKAAFLILAFLGLAASACAQTFGLGATVGLPNDVSQGFQINNFNHSDVTGWLDYRMEEKALLRLTYGNMRTQQSNAATITVPAAGGTGDPETRLLKERLEYGTVGVSYTFLEGFYTSGLFAGVGAYHLKPDAVPADFSGPHDLPDTVVGWTG